MVAALGLSVLAIVVSVWAARAEGQQTEDVAAALAEPVAQRVLADGRAESARAARDQLREANTRLIANRLPIVPEPAPDALSAIVQIQASRALLLADLGSVDTIAAGLRDQFGEQGAFPAAFLDDIDVPGPAAEPSDVVVPVLPSGGPTVVEVPPQPGEPSAPARPRTGPTPPAPARSAPAPVPAPAPAPRPAPPATRPAPGPLPLLPGVRLPPLIG